MLSTITQEEFNQYLDFAYQLALDPNKSGYPTYTDGIKTKEDFIKMAERGLEGEPDEILLFRQNGRVEGWIHYFWEQSEKYLQTCTFNIHKGTADAVRKFLDYIGDRFSGYHVSMGFPEENRKAIESLLHCGFQCIEESYNNSFFFENYDFLLEPDDVRCIDAETYHDFRSLHAQRDGNMYWDSDHILANISEWNINVCYKEQLPVGAIYFRGDGPMLEIYGIDFAEGVFDESICRALLVRALNEGKRSGAKYMTCFFEQQDDSRSVAAGLGFECVGKYLCFEKTL